MSATCSPGKLSKLNGMQVTSVSLEIAHQPLSVHSSKSPELRGWLDREYMKNLLNTHQQTLSFMYYLPLVLKMFKKSKHSEIRKMIYQAPNMYCSHKTQPKQWTHHVVSDVKLDQHREVGSTKTQSGGNKTTFLHHSAVNQLTVDRTLQCEGKSKQPL